MCVPRRTVTRAMPATICLAALLSGCLAPAGPPTQAIPQEGLPAQPHVVVALVDSGINPYHVAFQAPPDFVLPKRVLAAAPTSIKLTLGSNWTQDFEADKAFWDQARLNTLYWFEGTRVLAIAMGDPSVPQQLYDDAPHHGTGTASAVLAQDPEAIVLMVEVNSASRTLPPFFDPTYVSRGIHWVASQPWIDVVSVSIGMPAGIPLQGFDGIPADTLDAVEAGKVVVASVGNDATPSLTDQIAGPPWVVKAGGVEPTQHGEALLASKLPDFVANFSALLPCADSVDARCSYIGTSFSSPLVAGAFSRAIHDLRVASREDGGITDGALVDGNGLRVTKGQLRDAFNRTAAYWNTTDFAPTIPNTTGDPLLISGRVTDPILPAPWVQMGWGYVGPGLGDKVARLLGAHEPLPAKPAEAAAYMAALDAARHAYWDGHVGR